MARNSGGTYSLPAGNPVVTGTVVSSTWANATMPDVGAELTDSLSRSGKGGMLAQLGEIDGTAASPAYSFTADTDTGLYRIGANNPGLALGGVAEWDIQAGKLKLLTNTNPAKTTAFTNTLTPKNIIKATGFIALNTTATPAFTEGFGIASVAASATIVTVTFAQAFADANYVVTITPQVIGAPSTNPYLITIGDKLAASVTFSVFSASVGAGSTVALVAPSASTALQFNLIAVGAQ